LDGLKEAHKRASKEEVSYHQEIQDEDYYALSQWVTEKSGNNQTKSEISRCEKKQKGLLNKQTVFEISEKDKVSFVTFDKFLESFRAGSSFDLLVFSQENEMKEKTCKHDES